MNTKLMKKEAEIQLTFDEIQLLSFFLNSEIRF